MRKTIIGTAALAATMLTTFAMAQETEAEAGALPEEAAPELTQDTSAPQAAEETMPVFVSGEVVQELPEESTPELTGDVPAAESLRELVSDIAAPQEMTDEMRCLAGAVYFEARGEPLAGQLAVAQVVINRSGSNRFPSSYCGVVYQRAQFSFVRGGTMPRIKTGSAAWARAKKIARIAHQGLWDSEAQDSPVFPRDLCKPTLGAQENTPRSDQDAYFLPLIGSCWIRRAVRILAGGPFSHQSPISTQTGVWSDDFSRPRYSLSTPALVMRSASSGDKQDVIDPETVVALPRARLVVPERPDPAARVERVDRVGPAIGQHARIGIAAFRLHQCIARHRLG